MNTGEKSLIELEKRIERLEKLVENLISGKDGIASDLRENSVVKRYDFTDEKCRSESGWKICNAENIESDKELLFSTVQVERTLGVYCDPMLINENINLELDDIKQVHVRLKSNVDATQKCMLRVYFTTDKHTGWSQSKSVDNYYPAGRKYDVYVDTRNRYWTGTLSKLRIDPVEGLKGSIEIELVELIDSSGNAKYCMDFTKIDSLKASGWTVKNASDVTCNGRLFFNVDVLEKKRVYTDPFIVITNNFCVDADSVKYIRIKMRADIETKDKSDIYMQILFKTDTSNFWAQDKSMRFTYTPGKDIDAFIEIKQLFWKGKITALRIDPFENHEGKAGIKLIELLSDVPDDRSIEFLQARTRRLEDRFNKIYEQ